MSGPRMCIRSKGKMSLSFLSSLLVSLIWTFRVAFGIMARSLPDRSLHLIASLPSQALGRSHLPLCKIKFIKSSASVRIPVYDRPDFSSTFTLRPRRCLRRGARVAGRFLTTAWRAFAAAAFEGPEAFAARGIRYKH